MEDKRINPSTLSNQKKHFRHLKCKSFFKIFWFLPTRELSIFSFFLFIVALAFITFTSIAGINLLALLTLAIGPILAIATISFVFILLGIFFALSCLKKLEIYHYINSIWKPAYLLLNDCLSILRELCEKDIENEKNKGSYDNSKGSYQFELVRLKDFYGKFYKSFVNALKNKIEKNIDNQNELTAIITQLSFLRNKPIKELREKWHYLLLQLCQICSVMPQTEEFNSIRFPDCHYSRINKILEAFEIKNKKQFIQILPLSMEEIKNIFTDIEENSTTVEILPFSQGRILDSLFSTPEIKSNTSVTNDLEMAPGTPLERNDSRIIPQTLIEPQYSISDHDVTAHLS